MAPILYEAIEFERQVLGPARTKDTEKTLTITLAAGKGTIVTAKAYARGTATEITKCAAGVEYDLYVSVRNDGSDDTIWVTAKDKDTGTLLRNAEGITFDYSSTLGAGKTLGVSHNRQVMPNKNLNILIEAGHGK